MVHQSCLCKQWENGVVCLKVVGRTCSMRNGKDDLWLCRQNEMCVKIDAAIKENRNIRLSLLPNELGVPYGTVQKIVIENLGYRKICSRWIPRKLTDEQKTRQFCCSMENLQRFLADGNSFLEIRLLLQTKRGCTTIRHCRNALQWRGSIRCHRNPLKQNEDNLPTRSWSLCFLTQKVPFFSNLCQEEQQLTQIAMWTP